MRCSVLACIPANGSSATSWGVTMFLGTDPSCRMGWVLWSYCLTLLMPNLLPCYMLACGSLLTTSWTASFLFVGCLRLMYGDRRAGRCCSCTCSAVVEIFCLITDTVWLSRIAICLLDDIFVEWLIYAGNKFQLFGKIGVRSCSITAKPVGVCPAKLFLWFSQLVSRTLYTTRWDRALWSIFEVVMRCSRRVTWIYCRVAGRFSVRASFFGINWTYFSVQIIEKEIEREREERFWDSWGLFGYQTVLVVLQRTCSFVTVCVRVQSDVTEFRVALLVAVK